MRHERIRFDTGSLNRTFAPLVAGLLLFSGVFGGGLFIALIVRILA